MKKSIQKNKKSKEAVVELKPFNIKNYYYLLAIIVFFVFANTISGGYNLDDELVTINHRFTSQGLNAVKDIFTNSYYADAMGYAYGYRPMVHLSFAIEHQFFGQSPKVSHFFNVILYVLSIVLFFKLLLKWFGVEQWKIAFLAVILFALHPVHTEVVASIKNRDEILAFLFIILTGLSMAKYLDKSKITSLLWMIALFTMAMLSKKSAYPLAIILPVAFILFRDVSKKQLIWMSISVIIPAAIIGSELSVLRLILMLTLPSIGISLIYLIKIKWLNKEMNFNLKAILLKPYLPAILIALIAGWAFYSFSYELLFLTIPFLFWLIRTNFQLGLTAIVLISFGLIGRFGYREFGIFPLIITIGHCLYLFTKRKESNPIKKLVGTLWITLLIASVTLLLNDSLSLISILLLINTGLFFWLIFKKPKWGILYGVITSISVTLIYMNVNFYSVILLTISILMALKDTLKLKSSFKYLVVVVFSGMFVFFWSESNQLKQNQVIPPKTELPTEIQKSTTTPEQKSFLKEGRKLEFAENTLVAPHTTQETIGTGATTLGEYIRLMVFPNELSFYYGFARMDTVSLSNPFVWISILIHLGLIFLAIWQLRKRPIISFGILWYLLSIILFSNWVELVAGMVAERLIFIASAGFCIFIAGLVFWIKPNFLTKKPFLAEGLVGLILIAFAFKTIHRNSLWKDPITLMGHDIKHLQNSAQANNLYALRLMEYSTQMTDLQPQERNEIHKNALYHFSNAVEIDSLFFNALFDKGRAAQFMGDTLTAIETFKVAIQRQPGFLDSYQYLLMEYEKMGDWENYLQTAKKLVSVNDIPSNYDFISKGFFMQNQPDSSLLYINQGLTKFPGEPSLIDRKKYLESVISSK